MAKRTKTKKETKRKHKSILLKKLMKKHAKIKKHLQKAKGDDQSMVRLKQLEDNMSMYR